MGTSPPARPSGLSPADTALLAELVAAVLAADPPRQRLQQELDLLARQGRPAVAAALFENLVYRVDVAEYWLWHRMWQVYRTLGPERDDAAYWAAATAVWMQPDWSGSSPAFADMFRILIRRGRPREAAALFHHQIEQMPERPMVEPREIEPLLRRIGEAPPPRPPTPIAPGARRDHPVFAAEERAPQAIATPGGRMPHGLVALGQPMRRPRVDVAELPDGELLLCRDSVVVLDRDGRLHEDLSVCWYPEQVRRKVERLHAAGGTVSQFEAEQAVLISDRFPAPNLCHMLFDQISRLAVYRKIGVDASRALVVGPEQPLPFQQAIARRAGVTQLLGTDRIARLRARRLLVSSNCRDLQHAGQLGAPWAVEFVRETLGGRGGKAWRRLYVSRADAGSRKVVNEAEVIALLEEHGFDAIVPSRMPYEAQLAAFRQASHVIAPHGAALAHIVLCPEAAQVLEIFHPLYGTYAYAMIAAASGVNYAAMVAHDALSDAPEWNDPTHAPAERGGFVPLDIRVDLDALAAYLASAA